MVVFGGEKVVLERHGKKVAQLVPYEEPPPPPPAEAPSTKGWERMKRRGRLIEAQNRDRLRGLTMEQAISDLQSLLRETPAGGAPPARPPHPVSLARILVARKHRGAK